MKTANEDRVVCYLTRAIGRRAAVRRLPARQAPQNPPTGACITVRLRPNDIDGRNNLDENAYRTMLWFRACAVRVCTERADVRNADHICNSHGRAERGHEGELALLLRPVACSLPSAVSGRRLAVPPLPCHSRLPPLSELPANPASTAGIGLLTSVLRHHHPLQPRHQAELLA